MPVLVPPSTQPVPNGYSVPRNEVVTFVLNTGDRVTYGVSGSQPGAGGDSSHEFGAYLYEDGTNALIHTMAPDWGTAEQTTYTATRPIGLIATLQIGGNRFTAPTGTAFGYFLETNVLPLGNCQYGTRPKAQYQGVINITDSLIDLVLARYGASWLKRVLAQLLWGTIDSSSLCGAGPPALPPIDKGTVEASIPELLQIWRALAWAELCECTPGAPAPTPYPPYVVSVPTGWPPPLVFECAPGEECVDLVKIEQQLATILNSVADTRGLVTLLQRYVLPMAYVPGLLHEGLSGSLAFGVTRLVGIKVILKAAPDGLQAFTGVPLYVTDLGWLSIVTADGLVDEVRYTRQEQVWMPRHMPTALSVGLALREGVVVDVLELKPEP